MPSDAARSEAPARRARSSGCSSGAQGRTSTISPWRVTASGSSAPRMAAASVRAARDSAPSPSSARAATRTNLASASSPAARAASRPAAVCGAPVSSRSSSRSRRAVRTSAMRSVATAVAMPAIVIDSQDRASLLGLAPLYVPATRPYVVGHAQPCPSPQPERRRAPRACGDQARRPRSVLLRARGGRRPRRRPAAGQGRRSPATAWGSCCRTSRTSRPATTARCGWARRSSR